MILLLSLLFSAAQAAQPAPLFRFESNEFWLNLHHYLYVLGRAQAKTGDASREAVVKAPADEARGLAGLSEAERGAWREAVTFYRKAWWPAHQAANRARQTDIQTFVDRYGRQVLEAITRAYAMEWPAGGYPVHLSAFSNWAGAYSTRGNLLVMSSLAEDLRGAHGLETAFHEGMHQWDSAVMALLSIWMAQARATKRSQRSSRAWLDSV